MTDMYTLNRGGKTLGLTYRNQNYVIGFKSAGLARKVHYNMHPEPRLSIIKGKEINITSQIKNDLPLDFQYDYYLDNTACLIVPKLNGDFLHPLNDGGFHVNTVKTEDFYLYPYKYNLGIILPRTLEHEDSSVFLFTCSVLRNNFNSMDDD